MAPSAASKQVMDDSELRDALITLHSASFAWALVCCRDRNSAEEVLQSVYAKILDGRAPHDGRASFRTWLFAVIRHATLDHQRKRWWARVVRLEFKSLAELIDPKPNRSTQDGEDEELTLVRAALDQLPDRQRAIAHLVFYEDLSVADAAEAMGISVGAARRHYARAKETLKDLLKPLEPNR